MNAPEDLPADVRDFILEKIDSVPHLEALLLIWEQPNAEWTDESLARALYIDIPFARKIGQDLLRRGWTIAHPERAAFIFHSDWDPKGEFMRRLAGTYRRHLIRVTTLIHSNASAAVRDFARAFDLNKD